MSRGIPATARRSSQGRERRAGKHHHESGFSIRQNQRGGVACTKRDLGAHGRPDLRGFVHVGDQGLRGPHSREEARQGFSQTVRGAREGEEGGIGVAEEGPPSAVVEGQVEVEGRSR